MVLTLICWIDLRRWRQSTKNLDKHRKSREQLQRQAVVVEDDVSAMDEALGQVQEQKHSVATYFDLDNGGRMQHREERKRTLETELDEFQSLQVDAEEYKQERDQLRDEIYQLERKKMQLQSNLQMGGGVRRPN